MDQQLYGGAMACGLPQGFADVSQFRQVPDNQEVFTHVSTGACVIVELLARQQGATDDSCGAFFFHDLAQTNGSPNATITLPQRPIAAEQLPHIPFTTIDDPRASPCQYACIVGGTQSISKFTNEAGKENLVFIAMGILRFPSPVSTDILVTVSAPQVIAPESSEARVVDRVLTPHQVSEVLEQVLSTLRVNNWGLFVPE